MLEHWVHLEMLKSAVLGEEGRGNALQLSGKKEKSRGVCRPLTIKINLFMQMIVCCNICIQAGVNGPRSSWRVVLYPKR